MVFKLTNLYKSASMLVAFLILFIQASCRLEHSKIQELKQFAEGKTPKSIIEHDNNYFLLGLANSMQSSKCSSVLDLFNNFQQNVLPQLMAADKNFQLLLAEEEKRITILPKIRTFFISLVELNTEVLGLNTNYNPLISPLIPLKGFNGFDRHDIGKQFYDLRQYLPIAFSVCTKSKINQRLLYEKKQNANTAAYQNAEKSAPLNVFEAETVDARTFEIDNTSENIIEDFDPDKHALPQMSDPPKEIKEGLDKIQEAVQENVINFAREDEITKRTLEAATNQNVDIKFVKLESHSGDVDEVIDLEDSDEDSYKDENTDEFDAASIQQTTYRLNLSMGQRDIGQKRTFGDIDAGTSIFSKQSSTQIDGSAQKTTQALKTLRSWDMNYDNIAKLDTNVLGALIYLSASDWANKFSGFLGCGNISYFNLQQITVFMQKLFFYFIIDPEYMYEFFGALFRPLSTTSFSVTDPLISVILLHGKMFGCYHQWYELLNSLQHIKAQISEEAFKNPVSDEEAIKAGTVRGIIEGLTMQFAAKYQAFIEASWQYANAEVKSKLGKTNHSGYRFNIGKKIQQYFHSNIKFLFEFYLHKKAHTVLLITHFIEGIIEANKLHAASEAIEHIIHWIEHKADWAKSQLEVQLKKLKGMLRPHTVTKDDKFEFSREKLKQLFASDAFRTFSLGPTQWKSAHNDFYTELVAQDGLFQNLKEGTKGHLI